MKTECEAFSGGFCGLNDEPHRSALLPVEASNGGVPARECDASNILPANKKRFDTY